MTKSYGNETISYETISMFSDFVASKIGLYYPQDKYQDIQRALKKICNELNHQNLQQCINFIISSGFTPEITEVLTKYLTVGETFFFRDTAIFETLQQKILPEIISKRRQTAKYIRIISLACSTGEEPYSIAIMLHNIIPDIHKWHIYIHAVDINPMALKKAQEGIYNEWSFRATPQNFKNVYFTKTDINSYRINDKIKQMVTFSMLNLANDEERTAMLNLNTNADLIFCRNVFIYFTNSVKIQIASDIYKALAQNGILIVSPSEASADIFYQFTAIVEDNAIYYKKTADSGSVLQISHTSSDIINTEFSDTNFDSEITEQGIQNVDTTVEDNNYDTAYQAYLRQDYDSALKILKNILNTKPDDIHSKLLIARIYSGQGILDNAEALCEEILKVDKLNVSCLYLYGLIKQEKSQYQDAITTMKKILFLEPNFVLAHYNLGNLYRLLDKHHKAKRYYENTIELIKSYPADDKIPESEGLTYQELRSTIEDAIR